MSIIKTLAMGFAVAVVTISVSLAPTHGQTRNPAAASPDEREQTLKQLLTEVHELRLALQRASFSNTRFQMLLERVRVEQSHVDSLHKDLESVRTQISEFQAVKPRMDQQIKDAEAELDRTTDPNAHADLESRLKLMRSDLARLGPEEERLRTRETAMETEFEASQAKLSELNSQLDNLLVELKNP
jgi:predicted  nucleic acid-binding Zn-ribbon protein